MRRSPYQSLVAVFTLFLTILLTGLFCLATIGSSMVLSYFESKPQITVFFSDKATAADINMLKKILEDTGKVYSMKYVSKEDALTIYREQNKRDPLLLEMVTANILPASLEISAKEPQYLTELEPLIAKATNIEEVVFQKDVVDALLRWTNAIRWIGLALVGFLSLNSILTVMTVIGMKIALKKDEIEILKLVGASPRYIQIPFILEGGLYGIFGAFASWLVITVVCLLLRTNITNFLGMIPVIYSIFQSFSWIFVGTMAGILAILLFVGFFLGAIGSVIAMSRYLKF